MHRPALSDYRLDPTWTHYSSLMIAGFNCDFIYSLLIAQGPRFAIIQPLEGFFFVPFRTGACKGPTGPGTSCWLRGATRRFLPALGMPGEQGEPKTTPPCPSVTGPQPPPPDFSNPLSHWSKLRVAQTFLTDAFFRDGLSRSPCSHVSLTLCFSSIALITICDPCSF